MTDVIDSNEVEREKLLPVAVSCFVGYLSIMALGYFVGGAIF